VGVGGVSASQLPMSTSSGASSSALGTSGFGTTMSAGATASKAPPNLQMPIMNHQYLMGHGMAQFAAYGLPQQPMGPAYGYEDVMMSQRFPVPTYYTDVQFQPSSSMHAHLAAAAQGRTPNGTSTPGVSAASTSSTGGGAASAATGASAASAASSSADSRRRQFRHRRNRVSRKQRRAKRRSLLSIDA